MNGSILCPIYNLGFYGFGFIAPIGIFEAKIFTGIPFCHLWAKMIFPKFTYHNEVFVTFKLRIISTAPPPHLPK